MKYYWRLKCRQGLFWVSCSKPVSLGTITKSLYKDGILREGNPEDEVIHVQPVPQSTIGKFNLKNFTYEVEA